MIADDVTSFREFNRFHTRLVGALNEHLLSSGFSLPQVRVLYEIGIARKGQAPSAQDLATSLNMDPGYLSRLASGLEEQGLIARTPSVDNAKRLALTLTPTGKETYEKLNNASVREVESFMSPLSARERRELIGAMTRIRRLLGDLSREKTFILRDPEPGDLSWVTSRQAHLYTKEYGWDWTFEGLVAEIIGRFIHDYDPEKDRCWIAESEGEIVGSVFVVRENEETARLRLLYVEPGARGLGLGARLVDECIRFAGNKGYKKMVLWTNDILVSARRIYEAAGFNLIEEDPHHNFGKDLVGQVWERPL
ncbi:bifunctional helix-turn-helix transcriptional regulator/GNAT family N-acetyltransferase [Emcibacter sp.]|uniref:bifunctional helix-turn-helix transcriptional regulator/GNAT family N-acetyltransferase n=1 Tax=Emcibacter sp. TaxID=1979954 RepID=UPI003A94EA36